MELPGVARLDFHTEFGVRSDQTTSSTADFTPVKQGQTDGLVLRPVADEVKVTYEDR